MRFAIFLLKSIDLFSIYLLSEIQNKHDHIPATSSLSESRRLKLAYWFRLNSVPHLLDALVWSGSKRKEMKNIYTALFY